MTDEQKPHYWSYCDHCRANMVICGKCGNNCCNGGYGKFLDGSQCDACPAAYAMQDRGVPPASTEEVTEFFNELEAYLDSWANLSTGFRINDEALLTSYDKANLALMRKLSRARRASLPKAVPVSELRELENRYRKYVDDANAYAPDRCSAYRIAADNLAELIQKHGGT